MNIEPESLAAAMAQQNKLLLQIADDLSAIRKIVERSAPPVMAQQQDGSGLTIVDLGQLTAEGAETSPAAPDAALQARAGGHQVGLCLELEP